MVENETAVSRAELPLRCPFCGPNVAVNVKRSSERRQWVQCYGGCRGPLATSEAEAIQKWNVTRPPLAALPSPPSPGSGGEGPPFQARVQPWMMECFGPVISADRVERGDRLLEEVFELLQSGGYCPDRVSTLVDYVWGRPAGEPLQEVGGVMVTLAAYCLAHGLDMHAAGETELARINQPEIVEKIRAKQARKAAEIPFSPPPTPPAGEAK